MLPTLVPLVASLFVPPHRGDLGRGTSPRFMLPPALAGRDMAAEAIAAASVLRKDVPVRQHEEQRSLIMAAVRADTYAVLIGEVIQHITSGKRAGSTWIKPLALRSCSNVSLAVAQEHYDPTLGWVTSKEADASDSSSYVRLFSPLAHNVFLPTDTLSDPPASLALVVRMMAESHAASLAEDDGAAVGAVDQSEDFRLLRAFMSLLDAPTRPTNDDQSGSGLYDPLA